MNKVKLKEAEKKVFIKPTTAKGIIKQYELDGLLYKPAPSFLFYKNFRDVINYDEKRGQSFPFA